MSSSSRYAQRASGPALSAAHTGEGRGRAAPLMARWPLEVRMVAAFTLIVAVGAAVLSWSALTAFAEGAHIDAHITWIYPVVIDGLMAVGTVAALVLRSARLRTRAYVWALIASAIGISVAGNAAHASGAVLPPAAAALASAVPAAVLAASLHLLVTIVRASMRAESGSPRRAPRRPKREAGARPRRAPAAAGAAAILAAEPGATSAELGRQLGVSAGHARKLRAKARLEGAPA